MTPFIPNKYNAKDPLGSDLWGVDDITSNMALISGRPCLAFALYRRLVTPQNGLWYSPTYGFDLRQFINAAGVPDTYIRNQIINEVSKDARVLSVEVEIERDIRTLGVKITITDAQGPFPLVLNVNSLTVDMITFQ